MLFGGLQKLTTLDFPGVVSAVAFTQGCNFHCPYCHNAHLIPAHHGSEPGPVPEDVLAFLHKRRDILDGLVISGGEPLMQPDLEAFCRELKQMGYAVKLDTNGSFPTDLAALLESRLLDYVAVDVKTAPQNYAPQLCNDPEAGARLAETFAVLNASSIPFEARTTCFFPLTDASLLITAATVIPEGVEWRLQRGSIPADSASGMRRLLPGEETALLETLRRSLPDHAVSARPPFAE